MIMLTERYSKALEFAKEAHKGTVRKTSDTPYITHPIEVAEIVAQMSSDEDVIIAALLHDVVEDTAYTLEDISKMFGDKVAALVAEESEDKRRNQLASETWKLRKLETIEHLKLASTNVKIMALADKLSNLRSMYTDIQHMGDRLWDCFNQKDKSQHEWYHREISNAVKELSNTVQWQEYVELCDKVFK